jgi:hypothetical protein
VHFDDSALFLGVLCLVSCLLESSFTTWTDTHTQRMYRFQRGHAHVPNQARPQRAVPGTGGIAARRAGGLQAEDRRPTYLKWQRLIDTDEYQPRAEWRSTTAYAVITTWIPVLRGNPCFVCVCVCRCLSLPSRIRPPVYGRV